MTDAAPELLASIRERFNRLRASDKELGPLIWGFRDGNADFEADYETASKLAIRLGELLADALKREFTPDKLPDGRIYYNIAKGVLEPLLSENYDLVAYVAGETQRALNKAAGLGLEVVRPTINQSRINGIVNKISGYDTYEDAAWMLDEPIVNFSQSVVDDTICVNVAAHAAAGLHPVIQRIAEAGCCPWCSSLEGKYSYPVVVEKDVYRRHERCRCLVLYDPGEGKVQDVHTKILYANAAKAERDARIARVREAERSLAWQGQK